MSRPYRHFFSKPLRSLLTNPFPVRFDVLWTVDPTKIKAVHHLDPHVPAPMCNTLDNVFTFHRPGPCPQRNGVALFPGAKVKALARRIGHPIGGTTVNKHLELSRNVRPPGGRRDYQGIVFFYFGQTLSISSFYTQFRVL